MLNPTCDPHVWIEARADGYVRYRRSDGRRWEVFGVCNGCGKCWEGAVDTKPELDCPVTPEFDLCDVFTFTELEPHAD